MAEHDITLVTSKTGSIIAENFKVSLATATSSLTPATITSMVGIANGEALQLAPAVTNAMSVLTHHAGLIPNSAGYISGVSGAGGTAETTLSSLTSMQSQILPSGNHAAFGQILSQAQGHIADSLEITKTINYLENAEFSDFGANISSVADLATQGIDKAFGNLQSAGTALNEASKVANLADMPTVGTLKGLYNKLKSSKLANYTGISDALTKAGVDINDLGNTVYAEKTKKAFSLITDSEVLKSVSEQFGINSPKIINLGDYADLSKIVTPGIIPKLTTDFGALATKLGGMGASFASGSLAKDIMSNLEIPDVPTLVASAPSMSSLITDIKPAVTSLTGTAVGSSPLTGNSGLPSMTDFTHVVSGGPELSAIDAPETLTAEKVTALADSIGKTANLLAQAGIDTGELPLASLGTAMVFASSLHKFGEDREFSGVSGVLSNMANTASKYGDAIKLSLIEGKNKATLALAGIRPIQYSPNEKNPTSLLPGVIPTESTEPAYLPGQEPPLAGRPDSA